MPKITLFDHQEEIQKAPFIFSFNEHEAERFLKSKAEKGLWLLRTSSKPDCLVISYLRYKDCKCKHLRLGFIDGKWEMFKDTDDYNAKKHLMNSSGMYTEDAVHKLAVMLQNNGKRYNGKAGFNINGAYYFLDCGVDATKSADLPRFKNYIYENVGLEHILEEAHLEAFVTMKNNDKQKYYEAVPHGINP